MRRLYNVLVALAAPCAFAVVMWRGFRDRAYWQHVEQRFGFGAHLSGARPLWLHAVSLGEMTAAAPLVNALRSRYPKLPLLLTTATPAGRARAEALFPDIGVRYLPYDTAGSVRRFLRRVRPRVAVIMETELWPNVFHQCGQHGTPLLLANARLSQRSVTGYRRFDSLVRGVFAGSVQIAAQTEEDAERFVSIGASAAQLHVVGNMKFDLQPDPQRTAHGHLLRDALGRERPVWIAGSTHAGEETQVLDAHSRLLAGRPDALLMLAPRHKDRFDAVADLLAQRGFSFVRRAACGIADPATQVVLADTLGELSMLYAAADVAFVGGSLVPIGGHNLLEPAALGVPVLTGPSQSNAKEVARLLLERGAAVQVNNAAELAEMLGRWLGDPDERNRRGVIGTQLVAAHRGAVERLLELIGPLLTATHP